MKIDKAGVAWGVLFGVVINGLYNGLLSLLHENFQEVALISIATILLVVIVLIGFRKILFPPDKP